MRETKVVIHHSDLELVEHILQDLGEPWYGKDRRRSLPFGGTKPTSQPLGRYFNRWAVTFYGGDGGPGMATAPPAGRSARQRAPPAGNLVGDQPPEGAPGPAEPGPVHNDEQDEHPRPGLPHATDLPLTVDARFGDCGPSIRAICGAQRREPSTARPRRRWRRIAGERICGLPSHRCRPSLSGTVSTLLEIAY